MPIILNDRFTGISEPEVKTYIDAVEQADGQLIEYEVANAINEFVRGCKNDGIWDAIKASCILAGARTLDGALVPLRGAAPTEFSFVSADYDRKTGLIGASGKYIDSNRSNSADPQNSNHMAIQITSAMSGVAVMIGSSTTNTGTNNIGRTTGPTLLYRSRNSTNADTTYAGGVVAGFYGISRDNSENYVLARTFVGQPNSFSVSTITQTSQTPDSANIVVLQNTETRIRFYSIGESLNLTLLNTRVTTLMNTFSSVIP